ncbi:MAG: hypothetical protein U1E34_00865 [Amaricoccus sp.]
MAVRIISRKASMAAPLAAAPDARPSDIEREISAAWKAHKRSSRWRARIAGRAVEAVRRAAAQAAEDAA